MVPVSRWRKRTATEINHSCRRIETVLNFPKCGGRWCGAESVTTLRAHDHETEQQIGSPGAAQGEVGGDAAGRVGRIVGPWDGDRQGSRGGRRPRWPRACQTCGHDSPDDDHLPSNHVRLLPTSGDQTLRRLRLCSGGYRRLHQTVDAHRCSLLRHDLDGNRRMYGPPIPRRKAAG